MPVTIRPDASRGRDEQAPKSRICNRPTWLRASPANAVASPTVQRRRPTVTRAAPVPVRFCTASPSRKTTSCRTAGAAYAEEVAVARPATRAERSAAAVDHHAQAAAAPELAADQSDLPAAESHPAGGAGVGGAHHGPTPRTPHARALPRAR